MNENSLEQLLDIAAPRAEVFARKDGRQALQGDVHIRFTFGDKAEDVMTLLSLINSEDEVEQTVLLQQIEICLRTISEMSTSWSDTLEMDDRDSQNLIAVLLNEHIFPELIKVRSRELPLEVVLLYNQVAQHPWFSGEHAIRPRLLQINFEDKLVSESGFEGKLFALITDPSSGVNLNDFVGPNGTEPTILIPQEHIDSILMLMLFIQSYPDSGISPESIRMNIELTGLSFTIPATTPNQIISLGSWKIPAGFNLATDTSGKNLQIERGPMSTGQEKLRFGDSLVISPSGNLTQLLSFDPAESTLGIVNSGMALSSLEYSGSQISLYGTYPEQQADDKYKIGSLRAVPNDGGMNIQIIVSPVQDFELQFDDGGNFLYPEGDELVEAEKALLKYLGILEKSETTSTSRPESDVEVSLEDAELVPPSSSQQLYTLRASTLGKSEEIVELHYVKISDDTYIPMERGTGRNGTRRRVLRITGGNKLEFRAEPIFNQIHFAESGRLAIETTDGTSLPFADIQEVARVLFEGSSLFESERAAEEVARMSGIQQAKVRKLTYDGEFSIYLTPQEPTSLRYEWDENYVDYKFLADVEVMIEKSPLISTSGINPYIISGTGLLADDDPTGGLKLAGMSFYSSRIAKQLGYSDGEIDEFVLEGATETQMFISSVSIGSISYDPRTDKLYVIQRIAREDVEPRVLMPIPDQQGKPSNRYIQLVTGQDYGDNYQFWLGGHGIADEGVYILQRETEAAYEFEKPNYTGVIEVQKLVPSPVDEARSQQESITHPNYDPNFKPLDRAVSLNTRELVPMYSYEDQRFGLGVPVMVPEGFRLSDTQIEKSQTALDQVVEHLREVVEPEALKAAVEITINSEGDFVLGLDYQKIADRIIQPHKASQLLFKQADSSSEKNEDVGFERVEYTLTNGLIKGLKAFGLSVPLTNSITLISPSAEILMSASGNNNAGHIQSLEEPYLDTQQGLVPVVEYQFFEGLNTNKVGFVRRLILETVPLSQLNIDEDGNNTTSELMFGLTVERMGKMRLPSVYATYTRSLADLVANGEKLQELDPGIIDSIVVFSESISGFLAFYEQGADDSTLAPHIPKYIYALTRFYRYLGRLNLAELTPAQIKSVVLLKNIQSILGYPGAELEVNKLVRDLTSRLNTVYESISYAAEQRDQAVESGQDGGVAEYAKTAASAWGLNPDLSLEITASEDVGLFIQQRSNEARNLLEDKNALPTAKQMDIRYDAGLVTLAGLRVGDRIGYGAVGEVYKVTIAGQEYALKLSYSEETGIEQMSEMVESYLINDIHAQVDPVKFQSIYFPALVEEASGSRLRWQIPNLDRQFNFAVLMPLADEDDLLVERYRRLQGDMSLQERLEQNHEIPYVTEYFTQFAEPQARYFANKPIVCTDRKSRDVFLEATTLDWNVLRAKSPEYIWGMKNAYLDIFLSIFTGTKLATLVQELDLSEMVKGWKDLAERFESHKYLLWAVMLSVQSKLGVFSDELGDILNRYFQDLEFTIADVHEQAIGLIDDSVYQMITDSAALSLLVSDFQISDETISLKPSADHVYEKATDSGLLVYATTPRELITLQRFLLDDQQSLKLDVVSDWIAQVNRLNPSSSAAERAFRALLDTLSSAQIVEVLEYDPGLDSRVLGLLPNLIKGQEWLGFGNDRLAIAEKVYANELAELSSGREEISPILLQLVANTDSMFGRQDLLARVSPSIDRLEQYGQIPELLRVYGQLRQEESFSVTLLESGDEDPRIAFELHAYRDSSQLKVVQSTAHALLHIEPIYESEAEQVAIKLGLISNKHDTSLVKLMGDSGREEFEQKYNFSNALAQVRRLDGELDLLDSDLSQIPNSTGATVSYVLTGPESAVIRFSQASSQTEEVKVEYGKPLDMGNLRIRIRARVRDIQDVHEQKITQILNGLKLAHVEFAKICASLKPDAPDLQELIEAAAEFEKVAEVVDGVVDRIQQQNGTVFLSYFTQGYDQQNPDDPEILLGAAKIKPEGGIMLERGDETFQSIDIKQAPVAKKLDSLITEPGAIHQTSGRMRYGTYYVELKSMPKGNIRFNILFSSDYFYKIDKMSSGSADSGRSNQYQDVQIGLMLDSASAEVVKQILGSGDDPVAVSRFILALLSSQKLSPAHVMLQQTTAPRREITGVSNRPLSLGLVEVQEDGTVLRDSDKMAEVAADFFRASDSIDGLNLPVPGGVVSELGPLDLGLIELAQGKSEQELIAEQPLTEDYFTSWAQTPGSLSRAERKRREMFTRTVIEQGMAGSFTLVTQRLLDKLPVGYKVSGGITTNYEYNLQGSRLSVDVIVDTTSDPTILCLLLELKSDQLRRPTTISRFIDPSDTDSYKALNLDSIINDFRQAVLQAGTEMKSISDNGLWERASQDMLGLLQSELEVYADLFVNPTTLEIMERFDTSEWVSESVPDRNLRQVIANSDLDFKVINRGSNNREFQDMQRNNRLPDAVKDRIPLLFATKGISAETLYDTELNLIVDPNSEPLRLYVYLGLRSSSNTFELSAWSDNLESFTEELVNGLNFTTDATRKRAYDEVLELLGEFQVFTRSGNASLTTETSKELTYDSLTYLNDKQLESIKSTASKANPEYRLSRPSPDMDGVHAILSQDITISDDELNRKARKLKGKGLRVSAEIRFKQDGLHRRVIKVLIDGVEIPISNNLLIDQSRLRYYAEQIVMHLKLQKYLDYRGYDPEYDKFQDLLVEKLQGYYDLTRTLSSLR